MCNCSDNITEKEQFQGPRLKKIAWLPWNAKAYFFPQDLVIICIIHARQIKSVKLIIWLECCYWSYLTTSVSGRCLNVSTGRI